MKKKLLCIIFACFLFVGVPVKGYAASLSPLVFGMSEDVVLAFLASLLGVSARETINTYIDLEAYSEDLRLGFTEYIAGSATSMEIAEWIGRAALGNIDRDSVIWQKFYEYCMSNYVQGTAGMGTVPVNNVLSFPSFEYYDTGEAYTYNSNTGVIGSHFTGYQKSLAYTKSDLNVTGNKTVMILSASSENVSRFNYTYNGLTVYYDYSASTSYYMMSNPYPIYDVSTYEAIRADVGKAAWLMIYEGVTAVSGDAIISGAFDGVLTSSEINDLFDGTSVLQLYNPAVSQNGLQIVPDPENPNDIVVPAMLTADWYNFLQQFGPSGASQFVAAYNALNAVQGVSTGAIDAIYNNLGIASAISTAAQAAQGTLTLTDNNVFPQASTIADAVNGVIPGALTPQVPDSGIDNESDQGLYKLPDLKDFFPFCIPFDLIDLLSCFIAEPETPQFVIALSTGENTVTGQMDLHIWDNIASVLRGLELMAFTVGLILITRNIIRG